MAKKKKHRKRAGFTLSVSLMAGLLPGVSNAWTALNTGGIRGLGVQVSRDYLGYDPVSQRFYAPLMMGGTGPLLIGVLGHWVAAKFGINRMLANAKIPVLRL